ncbi:hypothetical protein DUZ99_04025 [Xylanibacillus composti]|uniref:YugN-like protein n=1 Tax=Xylanibacillus composti TaxID=1572762 RepID=A0A8J4H548_9BACL|nr:YugN family protein [Xylanibacillus composti]MDT9724154.1 hypothetical protein [Xylanibacillus composti]GIQ68703.1 hypothetical protein XYCOK13_15270 [Xylanibacillus composti]
MIIENNDLKGLKSELSHLDAVTESLGFVRWQWEYYRATYDWKLEMDGQEYYLRVNTRAIEGKLESPSAVLELQDAYIGRATFPHGLEYESAVPDSVRKQAEEKLKQLKDKLS